jgi:hypothetical protein
VTHDPDQPNAAGGEPPDRTSGTTPPAHGDWEVIAGPGGTDRERAPGAALRERWRRQSVRARAVTAAATVAVLALGGTVAYAATSSGSDGGATPGAAGSAWPSKDGPRDRHGHGPWFGIGGEAVHGEATVKDPDTGKWVVRIWQRGTVEKVDGDQVTVKSDDGATWTWTVNADTTVFRDGTKGSGAGDVKKGETAFLMGTRSDDGTRTAAHVLSGTRDDRDPGGWRDRFPGHGPHEWRLPSPSVSPSGSGATT